MHEPLAPSPTPAQVQPAHTPVMVRQVLDLLAPRSGHVCLDCTLGLAGHAALIAPRLAPRGRYIGLDVDPANLALARRHFGALPIPIDLIQANFRSAADVLRQLDSPPVDLLLADLGFSSNQMQDPARGLSFNADGPLDMRLDPQLDQSAADWVNRLQQDELADLIYRYGQDRNSRKIARKIVESRRQSPINSSLRLAQIVRQARGPRPHRTRPRSRKGIDPATRTFMALRIAVNAELDCLESLLHDLPRLLAPGATAVIISFHSLEDRLVKHAFNHLHRHHGALRLTPKPLVAGDQEKHDNPRSRSAKLRAIRWPPPS